MSFSAQTNNVCGNALRLVKWGGVGSLGCINNDIKQTVCLGLKAAWNKAWRYIYTKKDSLLLYINSLSFHPRKTPLLGPPYFVCANGLAVSTDLGRSITMMY